jgi:metallo-beta-lactamase family protein
MSDHGVGTAPSTLSFLGAAGTVTGSRFLIDHDGTRVLVDCGLFQGMRELRRRNWVDFPVDPASISAVVVTHAHLDHCGYLPALVRDGFTGPILATPDTTELAAIVLRDSARLQQEDAAFAARGGFSKHAPPRPLYDEADAERAVERFVQIDFEAVTEPVPSVTVTLRPAGHVLGSSTALLSVGGRRLLFTGDLGRSTHPLLRAPAPPPAADVVVTESTYGDRIHRSRDLDTLAAVVRHTLARHGVVLIPAFAVDRTELVLNALRQLMSSGAVPQVPVFVDSPMALATLDVYRRAIRDGHADVRTELVGQTGVLDPGDLRAARSSAESRLLNQPAQPCVVVSASGMATGGRVLHHLRQLLPDPRNSVVFVGHQAVGTRGRDLVEGARQVKMHGQFVPVHAQIVELGQFSAHADAADLVDWLAGAPRPPEACYVVHGEPRASAALQQQVVQRLGWPCTVPEHGQCVGIGKLIGGRT